MTRRQDWVNLGRKLEESRGDRTQQEVAEAADVGIRTISDLENPETSSRSRVRPGRAVRRLVKYYEWPPGALDRVLSGGEIEPLPPVFLPPIPAEEIETLRELARRHGISGKDLDRILDDRGDIEA